MKRQLLIGVISALAIGVIGLLFTQYYVSNFGKEQYVTISLVLSLLSAVLNLDGLQKPLVNEYVKDVANKVGIDNTVRMAMTFSLTIGLTSAIIFFAILNSIDGIVEKGGSGYIYLGAGFFICLFFLGSPHNSYLIFANRSHLNQVWKFVVYGTLFLFFYLISIVSGNVPEIFVGLFASALFGFIYLALVTRQSLIPVLNVFGAIRRFWDIFTLGLIINFSIFLFLVCDKFFLMDISDSARANYMIPYELILKFSILHGIFGSILLGRVASESNESAKDLSDGYYCYSIIYIGVIGLVCLNLFLYGPSFFYLWIGDEVNSEMMKVFNVLIGSFFFNSFGWLGFNILLISGRLSQVAKLYALMPIILMIGCWLLVEKFGVYGIAMSVTVSRLIDVALFLMSALLYRNQLIGAVKKLLLPIILFIPVVLCTIAARIIVEKVFSLADFGVLLSGIIIFFVLIALVFVVSEIRILTFPPKIEP